MTTGAMERDNQPPERERMTAVTSLGTPGHEPADAAGEIAASAPHRLPILHGPHDAGHPSAYRSVEDAGPNYHGPGHESGDKCP